MPTVEMEPEDNVEPIRSEKQTPPLRALQQEEEQEIADWLQEISQQSEVRIAIRRVEPRLDENGTKIAGHLDTVTEPIDQEYMKLRYGGGKYAIKVMTSEPGKSGFKYFANRTIEIAGPPKNHEKRNRETEGGLGSQAMDTMKELIDRNKSTGPSFSDISAMVAQQTAPYLEQLRQQREESRALQQQLAAKDERIMALLTQKPDTSIQDSLLNKMVGEESGRIQALQATHESELRQLRESHDRSLQRAREERSDDLKSMEKRHDREIDTLKDSHRQAMEAIKTSFETRIDGLKSQIASLERDLSEARGEVGALRAKKDKSLLEQAGEMATLKESMDGLFGGNKDEEGDQPWYARLAESVAPAVVGRISPAEAAAPAPAETAQPQPPQKLPAIQQQGAPQLPHVAEGDNMPPEGKPFYGPDGEIYVNKGGTPQRLPSPDERRQAAAAKKRKEQERKPSPSEVAMAVSFMESALAGNKPAPEFANSVRTMIPGGVLAYIEETGIDAFLDQAKLNPNSPLRTQAGRNWARDVAKFLLSGSVE